MTAQDQEQILTSKLSNALYPRDTVQLSHGFDAAASASGHAGSVRGSTEFVAKMMGGYWVGGTTTLTNERIVFTPNAMNIALQDGLTVIDIPLQDLTDVSVRWGVLTKIIDLTTRDRTISIRCFAAKKFAAAIEEQRKLQKSG